MLTPREEIELHRLRDYSKACCVGTWAAFAVAVLCMIAAIVGGPQALRWVGFVEGVVSFVFFALGRQFKQRRRELEELDR